MPKLKQKEQVKEVVCRHYMIITGDMIGECIYCGQISQYNLSGHAARIVRRGRINGVLTMVVPPPLEAD